ncbi:hypothetical protein [Jhaorihella thermophila]|uniref:Sulfotransferase family protein n=1 Tax=Jhaorihella thermophila TaxID=488547 RepID=A0A1H5SMC7_9RHOB|nr:hypothetical protein [Jhaorihella thermophila]SEF51773.1 hypothetical protein SAMN05421751_101625 [Jhaorihella thermophila]
MQIVFHAGAHVTDEDRLLKCLLRDRDALTARGVSVPGPRRYRPLIKNAFAAMEEAEPAEDARDVLIDAILDEEIADRVFLSNEHFFGSRRFAVIDNQFYPLAEQRLRHLRSLFPQDQIELFMAIRNPATFVPALLRDAAPRTVRTVLETSDPRALRWSDLFVRIRAAVPDVSITVWCNEDTPLIWGQILREAAGLEPTEEVSGALDLIAEIMKESGFRRLQDYLAKAPPMTEVHRRRVLAAFLDKYAREDAVEEELDLAGWTEELVEELTEDYDDDVARIQHIPGVNLIAP